MHDFSLQSNTSEESYPIMSCNGCRIWFYQNIFEMVYEIFSESEAPNFGLFLYALTVIFDMKIVGSQNITLTKSPDYSSKNQNNLDQTFLLFLDYLNKIGNQRLD